MTRRPAELAPEAWHGTMAAALERLERNWLRLYCASVPKRYRRTWLYSTVGWGPIGAAVFIVEGAVLRTLDRVSA